MPPLLVWLAGSLLTAASVRSQEALITVTALGQTPARIDHLPARYLPLGPVLEVEGVLVQVRTRKAGVLQAGSSVTGHGMTMATDRLFGSLTSAT